MNNDEIMTIEEVANYLKLKPQTVYKWVQENQIPGTKLGKEWRFRKKILDEWLDTAIILSKNGFDLTFQSSFLAAKRKALAPEELDQILKQALE